MQNRCHLDARSTLFAATPVPMATQELLDAMGEHMGVDAQIVWSSAHMAYLLQSVCPVTGEAGIDIATIRRGAHRTTLTFEPLAWALLRWAGGTNPRVSSLYSDKLDATDVGVWGQAVSLVAEATTA